MQVYIPTPVRGATYNITITAHYVFIAASPQRYSLAVMGSFAGRLHSPHNPAAADGSTTKATAAQQQGAGPTADSAEASDRDQPQQQRKLLEHGEHQDKNVHQPVGLQRLSSWLKQWWV